MILTGLNFGRSKWINYWAGTKTPDREAQLSLPNTPGTGSYYGYEDTVTVIEKL